MSALSDLLNRYIRESERFKGMSNRQIAKAAGVSRGTVDNYRSEAAPEAPKEHVLQAFHELLGIPLPELRAAAGVPIGELDPYSPPAEFNRLSRAQRDALDEFVRSFVGPQGERHAVPVDSSPESDAPAEAEQGEEVSRHYVIRMKNGPWQGMTLILGQAHLETAPPEAEYEVVQELPPGTIIETDGEPATLVVQLHKPDGTPDGPPRAVSRTQFDQLPSDRKVTVIWPTLGAVEVEEGGGSADDGQSGTPGFQSTVAGRAAELQVEDGDQGQEKSG